jgi:protein-disulfide isomerase
MNKHIICIWGLVAAVAACETSGPVKDRGDKAAAPAVRPATATEVYKVPLNDSPGRGGAAPKVTVVVFSEFQCPFCGRATATLDQVLRTYGDDVRLVWKHRPLPFHDRAAPAAWAAEAAREQGKFWEMHDRLFANQRALGPTELEEQARAIGLDLGRWKAALDSPAVRARVQADAALADQLAVQGTPTFFINGRPLVGAQPFAAFQPIIDEELKRADDKLRAGVARAALYAELTRDGLTKGTRPVAPTPVRGGDPAGEGELVRVAVDLGNVAGVTRGPADALVTIVEYSDFECPFCARVEPTLDRLLDEYKGRVRLVWKDFPLAFHDNATPAALAAREARAEGRFWEMHKQLFASQGALHRAGLEQAGVAAGLQPARLRAALDGEASRRAELEAEVAAASKLGVRGTPTFFINGRRLVGAQPYDRFKAVIDEELRRAEALVAKGTPRAKLYEALMKDTRSAEPGRTGP